MNRTTAAVALSLALAPGFAAAGSTTLSNKDLADYTVSVIAPDTPSMDPAAVGADGRAAGDTSRPVPTGGTALETPVAAFVLPAEKPRRPQPVLRRASAVKPAAATTAPATAGALSRRIVLHLGNSADITVSSAAGSTVREMRVDAETGNIELRVGTNAISIKAAGITGISFER